MGFSPAGVGLWWLSDKIVTEAGEPHVNVDNNSEDEGDSDWPLVLLPFWVFQHVLRHEAVDGEGHYQKSTHIHRLSKSRNGVRTCWCCYLRIGKKHEIGDDGENPWGQGVFAPDEDSDDDDCNNEGNWNDGRNPGRLVSEDALDIDDDDFEEDDEDGDVPYPNDKIEEDDVFVVVAEMVQDEHVRFFLLAYVYHQESGGVEGEPSEEDCKEGGGHVACGHGQDGKDEEGAADHAVNQAKDADLCVDLVGSLKQIFAVLTDHFMWFYHLYSSQYKFMKVFIRKVWEMWMN